MDDVLTAGKVVAGTVVGVLAADAYLIRDGRESVSSFCGRHFVPLVACTAALFCHFKGWPRFLRRIDPFAWAWRYLTPH